MISSEVDVLMQALRQSFGKSLRLEDLCKQAKLTPAALLKHVQALRKKGFVLEQPDAQTLVLKQSPDDLKPKEIEPHLKTNFIGRDLHYFNETPSETDAAFNLAQRYPEGQESITPLRLSPRLPAPGETPYAGNGSVVITELTTTDISLWNNPTPGLNLHAAVVLRPGILPMRAPQIALVAHVALARVIDSHGGGKPFLRSPNELTLQGKTVARIKVKMDSNVDRINFLILGFEVNLNGLVEELDALQSSQVTSLRQVSGKLINRPVFAAALFREMEKWYITYINKGPEKIVREINQYCRFDSKSLDAAPGGKTVMGVIEGLDIDGSLILRSPSGHIQRIAAGNILSAS